MTWPRPDSRSVQWGFAIHLASRDSNAAAVLPSGDPVGTPEVALDCACGLFFNDRTAWTKPPTNERRDH